MKYPFRPIDLRHYKGTLTDVRPVNDTTIFFEGYEGREKELLLL